MDSIITSMSDTLIVFDSQGINRTVNQAAHQLLGYTEKELVGHRLRRFEEDQYLVAQEVLIRHLTQVARCRIAN